MGKDKDEKKDVQTTENTPVDPVQQAKDEAAAAAAERKKAREARQQQEIGALNVIHSQETKGIQDYNKTLYNNQGEILKDIQEKISTAQENDKTAIKRENAYRYISGLGDTLSSLANLVGVANKASNQVQTYNSSKVVEKAEAARKARKLEMDDLSKRQDEMKARLLELQAAGSLREAEALARQNREKLSTITRHGNENAAADLNDLGLIRQAGLDAQNVLNTKFNQDMATKNYELQKKRRYSTSTNPKPKPNVDSKTLKLIDTKKKDPNFQKTVLNSNITGVRDELAQQMGYANYNEYLQYQNVSGWGKDIPGMRNREAKDIREQRQQQNPEVAILLDLLQSPLTLQKQDIETLGLLSTVFSDALQAGAETAAGVEAEKKNSNDSKGSGTGAKGQDYYMKYAQNK